MCISQSSKDGPSITNKLSMLLEPNPEMSWSKIEGKRAIIKTWMINLSFKINSNTEPERQMKTSNKLEDKIAIAQEVPRKSLGGEVVNPGSKISSQIIINQLSRFSQDNREWSKKGMSS